MTEKRFYLMNVEDPLHEYGRWCKPVLEDGETGKQYENALEVMDLLNELNDKCEFLEIENESLEDGATKYTELYHKSLKENEQLKQRNTNQYNQLSELWEIIEEENWEKLIAMKKQLKEDEERLQQEWKCYE